VTFNLKSFWLNTTSNSKSLACSSFERNTKRIYFPPKHLLKEKQKGEERIKNNEDGNTFYFICNTNIS
jgi:hypothetical protein